MFSLLSYVQALECNARLCSVAAFGGVPLAIAFLAPLLSIAGCFVAAADAKKTRNLMEHRLSWSLAILAVVLAVLGSFLSTVCS
jgi:hypothetical protein